MCSTNTDTPNISKQSYCQAQWCVFTRDSMCYSSYMPRQYSVSQSVCLFVLHGLSHVRVDCIKTAERIIEILFLSDRPIILVFHHQGLLRKSGGFTLTVAPNTMGVAIFDQYTAISRNGRPNREAIWSRMCSIESCCFR